MGCNALFAAVPPAIRPDAKIETRIEKILGRLTLEEKIGQMCQLTVSMVTDMNDSGHPFISDELLDTVIGHYKVGSILNVPFDEAQSREAWTQIIGRIQRRSLDCLGDSLHLRCRSNARCFLHPRCNLFSAGDQHGCRAEL